MVRSFTGDKINFTRIGGPVLSTYDGEYCTMCGPDFCAARLTHDLRKFKK